MKKPWPVDTPLMRDEILSSWIVRTAFENGSYPLAWSWYLWGKRRVWTIDIDRFCPVADILKLVTPNVSQRSLESATLYPWLRKIISNDLSSYKKAWPWLTTLGARNRERTGGLRYCPECMMNSSVYYRRSWRFSWNHSCTIHHCILRDTCPACSSSISPHKLDYRASNLALCSTCGYNLGKSSVYRSSEDALKMQSLINSILEGEEAELPWAIRSPIEFFETVRYLMSFLNRAHAIRLLADNKLLDLLGIVSLPNSPTQASIERISIDRMHSCSEAVNRILKYELNDFAAMLSLAGYSKTTFLSRLKLPLSPQIIAILNLLPNGVQKPRQKHASNIQTRQPTSREDVEAMWRELLIYLP